VDERHKGDAAFLTDLNLNALPDRNLDEEGEGEDSAFLTTLESPH
jgi:hypothetical protein